MVLRLYCCVTIVVGLSNVYVAIIIIRCIRRSIICVVIIVIVSVRCRVSVFFAVLRIWFSWGWVSNSLNRRSRRCFSACLFFVSIAILLVVKGRWNSNW